MLRFRSFGVTIMSTVDNPKATQTSDKDEELEEKGFFNRSRKGGKSYWDWLDLISKLAIPIVVLGATLFFGIQQANLANQQHDNDQKIANMQHEADQQQALDQQRQAALVTYQDSIKDLLLHQGLLTSNPDDEIRVIARTETLAAMRQLDGRRNSFLVQFLRDAHLIGTNLITGKDQNIVNFEHADLNSTDLSGVNLSGVNLRGVILYSANLSLANLGSTNLSLADLNGANLSRVGLREADLNGADLRYATLTGAILVNTNLTGALYLTQQQLDQVSSCKDAILPKGLKC
jgi:uncharacterized protein YjbI with pentapeptide repeats